jgi:hypothetical protein
MYFCTGLLNIVKKNDNTHKDKIDVFNPILKTDYKLSVMPNTTSSYYELFLSQFTKENFPLLSIFGLKNKGI